MPDGGFQVLLAECRSKKADIEMVRCYLQNFRENNDVCSTVWCVSILVCNGSCTVAPAESIDVCY